MGMIPGPAAVAVLAGTKLGGYVLAGRLLISQGRELTKPLTFALARGALGLIGWLVYWIVFRVAAFYWHLPESLWYVYLAPFRFLAWFVAIYWCFKPVGGLRSCLLYAALGVVWSYALDAAVLLVVQVTPSLWMPFC